MENDSFKKKSIDVKFSLFYSLVLMIPAILIIVDLLIDKERGILDYIFILIGVLMFAQGIYSLSGAKYIRLDMEERVITISGFFGLLNSKYKFERLYFKDKELYRIVDGQPKFFNIIRNQCKKKDFELFVEAVKNG